MSSPRRSVRLAKAPRRGDAGRREAVAAAGGPRVDRNRRKNAAATPLAVAASPPSPLVSLHSDLLTLIFTFLAPRPRIFVVSLVCRRWRRLALASITSWRRLETASDVPRALLLMPSLIEADIHFISAEMAFHSSLRSLTAHHLRPPAPSLTTLTALHFHGFNVAAVLHSCHHSLLRLSISFECNRLGDIYLPSLTSLEMPLSDNFRQELPFLALHASQLHTLLLFLPSTCHAAALGSALCSLSLPRLRLLQLCPSHILSWGSLLSLAPAGCETRIIFRGLKSWPEDLAPSMLQHTVHAVVYSELSLSTLGAILQQCPRLDSLYVRLLPTAESERAAVPPSLRAHAPRLKTLMVSWAADDPAPLLLLPLVTNLQTLLLVVRADQPHPLPALTPLAYPHVSQLVLCNVALSLECMPPLLRSFPRLNSLNLDGRGTLQREHVSILQQHGVEDLFLSSYICESSPEVIASKRELHWIELHEDQS